MSPFLFRKKYLYGLVLQLRAQAAIPQFGTPVSS